MRCPSSGMLQCRLACMHACYIPKLPRGDMGMPVCMPPVPYHCYMVEHVGLFACPLCPVSPCGGTGTVVRACCIPVYQAVVQTHLFWCMLWHSTATWWHMHTCSCTWHVPSSLPGGMGIYVQVCCVQMLPPPSTTPLFTRLWCLVVVLWQACLHTFHVQCLHVMEWAWLFALARGVPAASQHRHLVARECLFASRSHPAPPCGSCRQCPTVSL